MPDSLTDIAARKSDLRREALRRRGAMGRCARSEAILAAARKALPVLARIAGPVALFAAIRDELDPAPLAGALRLRGIPLALPAVVEPGAPLAFHRWDSDDPLAPAGRPPIPTPRAAAPALSPAAILVPLAAFDRAGGRIGYGGGFYDRTLAALAAAGHRPLTLGYAFSCQEVPQVPLEPHDVTLDMVITQDEIISCARG